MITMSTSSNTSSLNEFLTQHKPSEGALITHTRIGDKTLNIYGGAYNIPKEELPLFYRLYYENVFVKERKEYLTEKQPVIGPIAIDLDFHYEYSVINRQHTSETIN